MRRLVLLALVGCGRHESPPPPRGGNVVAHTTGPIAIDGDWDEPDWPRRAFRAQFVGDDGQLARPSSEIRLLRDDTRLIVALYAADENIETRDAFDLAVGPVSLHVDATGALTPALPGVVAKTGFDEGTLDDASDDDEEWVVELAIPLAAVGGGSVPVTTSRCDVPKNGVRRCGHWAGAVTID